MIDDQIRQATEDRIRHCVSNSVYFAHFEHSVSLIVGKIKVIIDIEFTKSETLDVDEVRKMIDMVMTSKLDDPTYMKHVIFIYGKLAELFPNNVIVISVVDESDCGFVMNFPKPSY